mmetsp:Transcript_9817/g.30767  ORF Transcript_9817/g.30767 Transcript_9817/m.30767 type:complete len:236 (-) Transcript_9817:1251-1958(-)
MPRGEGQSRLAMPSGVVSVMPAPTSGMPPALPLVSMPCASMAVSPSPVLGGESEASTPRSDGDGSTPAIPVPSSLSKLGGDAPASEGVSPLPAPSASPPPGRLPRLVWSVSICLLLFSGTRMLRSFLALAFEAVRFFVTGLEMSAGIAAAAATAPSSPPPPAPPACVPAAPPGAAVALPFVPLPLVSCVRPPFGTCGPPLAMKLSGPTGTPVASKMPSPSPLPETSPSMPPTTEP